MIKKNIFDDIESVCKAAANHIIDVADKSIKQKGKFSIALSGGNTPRKLYELLAQPPYATKLDWKNVFIFWSDERCVPLQDENNNSHMAFTSLLNKVPIPSGNIFVIPVQFEPADAASNYEQTITMFFKNENPVFDLILLGLGDNGHTASLFPYTSILTEKERLVKEVYVEEVKAWRITFTAKLINNAADILFLVTGAAKAAIIKTIFSGTKEFEKYPVILIHTTNAGWYVDKAAASQLKSK